MRDPVDPMSTDSSPAPESARRGAPPSTRRSVADRHPAARPWSNVVVPVCLVLLLAGLGAVLYTGRSRGGLTRVPTAAEKRRALCSDNLSGVVAAWRASGTIPAALWHERWGGQDGLGCANDDGVPYLVRDLDRFPVDASRAADEPIAVCLGLVTTTERWHPPHGAVVLVAHADGAVREHAWSEFGLADEPPADAAPPVVGPASPSPILRVMRLGR
jgi:hypothetical protein